MIDFDELANNKNFAKKEKAKAPGVVGLKVVNNFSDSTEEDKRNINRSIYTQYSSDLLSNIPQCDCGDRMGAHRLNVLCKICNSVVKSQTDQELHALVWIKAPEGVDAMINPIVWTMLNKRFSRSNFEIIRWLCDTSYAPLVRVPPVLEEVKALNIPRGYNNFIRNFDAIMNELFELRAFRVRAKERDGLREFIATYRNCIFSKYLPVPNKILMVVEETNLGTYVDPIIMGALDAIRTMVGIDSDVHNFSTRVKENRTIKAISLLADFDQDVSKDLLASKQGLFRRHVYGTRSHFSWRAVISSITDTYNYDEIHIPWGVGTSAFRLHLANKLFKRGMNPNEIVSFLNEHAQKYHPLLDELFQELIAEAPGGRGIPSTMGRNPSLARGSCQAVFVSKVKTNIDDPTVSIHILTVKPLNADFDGDAMNFTLALDEFVAEHFRHLAPHKSTFDLNDPLEVSGDLGMPKPVVSTFANWLHSEPEHVADPNKLALMESLFETT